MLVISLWIGSKTPPKSSKSHGEPWKNARENAKLERNKARKKEKTPSKVQKAANATQQDLFQGYTWAQTTTQTQEDEAKNATQKAAKNKGQQESGQNG
ncbi:hypothetical protein N7540_011695 [Penicillium herquei]|nr:hypothetical protein N7540_011695 [Penicillium herquei]